MAAALQEEPEEGTPFTVTFRAETFRKLYSHSVNPGKRQSPGLGSWEGSPLILMPVPPLALFGDISWAIPLAREY